MMMWGRTLDGVHDGAMPHRYPNGHGPWDTTLQFCACSLVGLGVAIAVMEAGFFEGGKGNAASEFDVWEWTQMVQQAPTKPVGCVSLAGAGSHPPRQVLAKHDTVACNSAPGQAWCSDDAQSNGTCQGVQRGMLPRMQTAHKTMSIGTAKSANRTTSVHAQPATRRTKPASIQNRSICAPTSRL